MMQVTELIEESDDIIGGFWGNTIIWWEEEDFNFGEQETFRAYGFKPYNQFPKKGHKIYAEMEKSHMLFEIVKVERCTNPQDMFFLELKPITQVKKYA